MFKILVQTWKGEQFVTECDGVFVTVTDFAEDALTFHNFYSARKFVEDNQIATARIQG